MLRVRKLVMLICLACCASVVQAADFDAYRRLFEEVQMERLAELQSNAEIRAFSTDGCSAGLSEGWRLLARSLPVFSRKFGDRPPYEVCCVAHDRSYWQGQTTQGYQRRREADELLRQCVMDTGMRIKAEVASEFSLSEATIENNFRIISELMYQAVRVGGLPCSYMPWRWGYGWAHCPVF